MQARPAKGKARESLHQVQQESDSAPSDDQFVPEDCDADDDDDDAEASEGGRLDQDDEDLIALQGDRAALATAVRNMVSICLDWPYLANKDLGTGNEGH